MKLEKCGRCEARFEECKARVEQLKRGLAVFSKDSGGRSSRGIR